MTLAPRSPTWPIQYGLGIMRFQIPRLFSPFSPVPALVGHSGSTGSWLFHCPERGLLLAGSVDQVAAAAIPYRFLPKVLRLLT
jgi:D-alanyl-D-alanine carboxypeptidase